MKKFTIAVLSAALVLVSCSNNSNDSKQAEASQPVMSGDSFEPTTNIRYYNLDSIMSQYNLCKDLNEIMMAKQNNIEAEQRAKTAELQSKQQSIESKARNNGYLTEQSYNADMQKFQSMYDQAQRYIANLQQEAAIESANQQKQFIDSVNNFLLQYNSTRHYDAIIVKSVGDYFNPALDITDEIISGLNARYKKPEATEAEADKSK
ncbi:MAG: OmpH family outer membrane protein [Muribaculaceae bacterium]|nr:OmpH family outer membrane protein [Muribaculaceae bacterium]